MAILPFAARTAGDQPALSPARQHLADVSARWLAQRERLDTFSQPLRDLDAANERVHLAEAELADIDRVEATALAQWTDNPVGPMPPPLSDERDHATAKLTAAQQAAIGPRRNADNVSQLLFREQQVLVSLTKERNTAVNDVLLEVIADLALEVVATARRSVALHNVLKGIMSDARQRLQSFNRDDAARAQDHLLFDAAQAALLGGREHRDHLRACAALDAVAITNRPLFAALAERLLADPAATLEVAIDGPAPVEAKRSA